MPTKPPTFAHERLLAGTWMLASFVTLFIGRWFASEEGGDHAFMRVLLPAVLVGAAVAYQRARSSHHSYLGALVMVFVAGTTAYAFSGQDRLVLGQLQAYERQATGQIPTLIDEALAIPHVAPSGPDRKSRAQAVADQITAQDALAARFGAVARTMDPINLELYLIKNDYSNRNAAARFEEFRESPPIRRVREILDAYSAQRTAENYWIRLLERAKGQWTVSPTGEVEFFDSISEKEVELFHTLDAELAEARAEFRRVTAH